METIKSYTDISQSKKLAEFLSLESADMFYPTNSDWEGKIIGLLDVPLYIGSDGFVDTEMGEIYAWSLAALLGVLKYPSLTQDIDNKWSITDWTGVYPKSEYSSDNPVDACVKMIIKLKEQNII